MRPSIRAVVLIALTSVPSELLACSPTLGVDRAQFYAAIERPPYILGGLSVLAAALWLAKGPRRARSRFVGMLLVALAVFQPAWWIHNSGDCGAFRDVAAFGIACTSMGLAAVGCWRERRRRRTLQPDDSIAGV